MTLIGRLHQDLLVYCFTIHPATPAFMPSSVKRRQIPPLVAQVSADQCLASSRTEVLQHAGYNVVTYISADELTLACKSLRFDLLLLGHSLENEGSDQTCALFREYKPDSPILQLQLMDGVPSAADYVFNVSNGPEALVTFIDQILLGNWAFPGQAKAAD